MNRAVPAKRSALRYCCAGCRAWREDLSQALKIWKRSGRKVNVAPLARAASSGTSISIERCVEPSPIDNSTMRAPASRRSPVTLPSMPGPSVRIASSGRKNSRPDPFLACPIPMRPSRKRLYESVTCSRQSFQMKPMMQQHGTVVWSRLRKTRCGIR